MKRMRFTHANGTFLLCKHSELQHLHGNYKKGLKLVLSIRDTSPPLSTLVDIVIIHVIKRTRPSPAAFAYFK